MTASVEPVVPSTEVVAPATVETEVAPLLEGGDDEAAYEAAFNAQLAKNAEKKQSDRGESDEGETVTPAAPAKEAAPAKPADAAKVETEAAAKPAPTAPAALTEDDEAIVAALPEDRRESARARFAAAEAARKEAEELRHSNRSMAGRVSAFQRKYEEAAGKRPADVAKAATAEQTDAYKQFAEDYPDVAKGMEALLAAKLPPGATPDIAEIADFVQQERQSRFLTEAWEAVESVHAGWRDKIGTKDFQDWQKSSPTYERLASSDDIADAIALLDLYDGHVLKSQPKATPIDPVQAADAAKLAARRGAQVDGAKAAATRTATPNTNIDMSDPDQLFAFYAAQSNKRIAKRNN